MYRYTIKMNMNYMAMADFLTKKNFVNDKIHFPFFMFATENVSCILSCMIE